MCSSLILIWIRRERKKGSEKRGFVKRVSECVWLFVLNEYKGIKMEAENYLSFVMIDVRQHSMASLGHSLTQ